MRRIVIPGALLVLLLVASPSAQAEDTPVVAQVGDLEVRILPSETADSACYRTVVGRPFEVRFELRNRGNEPLLLPALHPPFLRVRIWFVSPVEPPIIFGEAWGPAPLRSTLVEIPPGEACLETRTLVAPLSAEARVVVELRCSHTEVSEYRPVEQEQTPGGIRHGRCEWIRVDEPRLWHGVLRAPMPLHVSPYGKYDEHDDVVDPQLVRDLQGKRLDEVERLAAIDEIAVRDRTDRAVNLLRSGLPPAYTRQGPSRLERWLRTKHLVVAARRGYGYHALPHLLRIVEGEDEHLDVRRMALEGAVLLLDDYFLLRTDDHVYLFQQHAPLQERARLVFAELSAGEGPLAKRAKEIVEARAAAE